MDLAKGEAEAIQEICREKSITPVFGTIPPCNFAVYNHRHFEMRDIAHLAHEHQYDAMQRQHLTETNLLNSFFFIWKVFLHYRKRLSRQKGH